MFKWSGFSLVVGRTSDLGTEDMQVVLKEGN